MKFTELSLHLKQTTKRALKDGIPVWNNVPKDCKVPKDCNPQEKGHSEGDVPPAAIKAQSLVDCIL